MRRVTLGGPELGGPRPGGLTSAGPDQQVKLFFPRSGQPEPVLPVPRPRRGRDALVRGVLGAPRGHGDAGGRAGEGPATRWARSARPWYAVGMFGPSAVFATPVDPGSGDWTLLYADARALPALAAVVAALPPGQRAVAYVHVPDAAEAQPLPTAGHLTVRPLYGDISAVDALRADPLPDGRPYVWRVRPRPYGRSGATSWRSVAPTGGRCTSPGTGAAAPPARRADDRGSGGGTGTPGGHPREPGRTHLLRCGW